MKILRQVAVLVTGLALALGLAAFVAPGSAQAVTTSSSCAGVNQALGKQALRLKQAKQADAKADRRLKKAKKKFRKAKKAFAKAKKRHVKVAVKRKAFKKAKKARVKARKKAYKTQRRVNVARANYNSWYSRARTCLDQPLPPTTPAAVEVHVEESLVDLGVAGDTINGLLEQIQNLIEGGADPAELQALIDFLAQTLEGLGLSADAIGDLLQLLLDALGASGISPGALQALLETLLGPLDALLTDGQVVQVITEILQTLTQGGPVDNVDGLVTPVLNAVKGLLSSIGLGVLNPVVESLRWVLSTLLSSLGADLLA